MGELDQVVPPLKISPRGPAVTGRRAGDPGPPQPEPRVGRRPPPAAPPRRSKARPGAPGDPPAAAPVAARRRPGSLSLQRPPSRSQSGSRVLHFFHGVVQPTAVRSRQRWLPCLVLALCLLTGWMAIPAAATAPTAPKVEAGRARAAGAARGARA